MTNEPGNPPIVIDLLGGGGSGWLIPVADSEAWCDVELPGHGRRAPRPEMRGPFPAILTATMGQLVYDGPGLAEDRVQRIRSYLAADDARWVEFADGDRYRVAEGGRLVQRVRPIPREDGAADLDLARVVERALGAPLAIAMALRGIHVLHASAVEASGLVIALIGDSGAGKSTLAAAAVSHPTAGLNRLADDQLPVRLGERPRALPRFPQLKLLSGSQQFAGSELTGELPLAMVVELSRVAGETGPAASALPRLEPVRGADACLTLVGATVAARLFDSRLLATHLEQCVEASPQIAVRRLHYQSGSERLPAVLDLLTRELRSIGPPDRHR